MDEWRRMVLHHLNEFLGYGDLWNANYFFFGSEEGSDPGKKFPQIFKELLHPILTCARFEFGSGINGNPTYKGEAQIAFKLQNGCHQRLTKEYEDSFGKEGSGVFSSNVYPWGARNDEAWDEVSAQITGYRSKTTYWKDSWDATGDIGRLLVPPRKVIIEDFVRFILGKQNAWIFVMGDPAEKKLGPLLRDKFQLKWYEHPWPDQAVKDHFWLPDENFHICFIYHPSHGNFTEEHATKLCQTIRG